MSRNMQQKHITLLEVQCTEDPDWASDRSEGLIAEQTLKILPHRDSNTLQIELSQRQRLLHRFKCSLRNCYCVCHASSTRSGRFWSLKLPYDWNSCDRKTCHNYKRASIWISLN